MENKKIIGNTVGVPNPKSDWEQHDKSKADYVKNRTHYSESVLLWEYTKGSEDCNFEIPKSCSNLKLYVNSAETNIVLLNDENEEITLPYNGLVFVYAGEIVDESYEYFLGDINDNIATLWSTQEMSDIDSLKLYGETIVQLDEKYIPSSIARTQYVSELISEAIGEALEGDY